MLYRYHFEFTSTSQRVFITQYRHNGVCLIFKFCINTRGLWFFIRCVWCCREGLNSSTQCVWFSGGRNEANKPFWGLTYGVGVWGRRVNWVCTSHCGWWPLGQLEWFNYCKMNMWIIKRFFSCLWVKNRDFVVETYIYCSLLLLLFFYLYTRGGGYY